MNPKRLSVLLLVAALAAGAPHARATDGTHINQEALQAAIAAAIEQALPEVRVVEVEREVVVERDVVREVEVPARPHQVVSFGGTMDAQGCAHPGGVDSTHTAHLGYELEVGDFRFRADVADRPRGSDCREQGLTIDIAGTQTFDDFVGGAFLDLDVGYDEHGVTGFDRDNRVVFGSVKQTTAAVMLGWNFEDVPGELRAKAGWNVGSNQPRIGVGYALGEHVEVGFDCTGTDGDDPYCDANACWTRGFGDGWGVEACYEHSNGLEHLPDPFSGRADEPAANEANGLRVAFRRALGGTR